MIDTLVTKSNKLKKMGYMRSDEVLLCRKYSGLFKIKDESDWNEIRKITDDLGLVDDVTSIISCMELSPIPNSLFDRIKSKDAEDHIRDLGWTKENVLENYLEFYNEILISKYKFDSENFVVHAGFSIRLYASDAVKLSDELINSCITVNVYTDLGCVSII